MRCGRPLGRDSTIKTNEEETNVSELVEVTDPATAADSLQVTPLTAAAAAVTLAEEGEEGVLRLAVAGASGAHR